MFGRRGSTALPGWRIFGHRLSPVRGIGKGSGFGSGVSGSGGNWRRDAALYGRRDARRYRAAGGGRQGTDRKFQDLRFQNGRGWCGLCGVVVPVMDFCPLGWERERSAAFDDRGDI